MTDYIPKRTGAPPRIVESVEFRCWHVGIGTTEWRALAERIQVRRNWHKSTYSATVDGDRIGKMYHTLQGAMKAAALAALAAEFVP